eukprot:CAMPEP_0117436132 /NCGR_PEP_ID=MMETSP0759-20121206/849_1 /TAXON_ID=63605 /ORGANISM="Percolomonas cosmopolitus, Strain WS" /LENGTH=898 /DNA_ID=CAMNT_0005227721 /DNA_START=251 /DNA_END=2947 /DNA_ORIENTATION=-
MNTSENAEVPSATNNTVDNSQLSADSILTIGASHSSLSMIGQNTTFSHDASSVKTRSRESSIHSNQNHTAMASSPTTSYQGDSSLMHYDSFSIRNAVGHMKRRGFFTGSSDHHVHNSHGHSMTRQQRLNQDSIETIDWMKEEYREAKRKQNLFRKQSMNEQYARMHGFGASWLMFINRKLFYLKMAFYSAQGWILSFLIGVAAGVFAGMIDIGAEWMGSLREGLCWKFPWLSQKRCCVGTTEAICDSWLSWTDFMIPHATQTQQNLLAYAIYISSAAVMAGVSAWFVKRFARYAAGSGIPEAKTILGGAVIRGCFGIWTLIIKAIGLILSVGSGLSLGKEGPLVHVVCCCGNVFSRIFSKYHRNEAKKREILGAACAAGVAVAFGAPVGGVLFALEEACTYFPPKTLYRSFFASVIAALFLQLMNPHKTGKIVMFSMSYHTMWHWFELIPFMALAIIGGVLGALFNRANITVAKIRFRTFVKRLPIFEAVIVASLTAVLRFWNPFTRGSTNDLLAGLFNNSCDGEWSVDPLFRKACNLENYTVMIELILSGIIFFVLTIFTFGLRLPSGLFIPTLAMGACFGHVLGTLMKYLQETFPSHWFFSECQIGGETRACVLPGIYALTGAAACLSGVTRVTVSIVVIMFELTGGLEYIVPLMLTVVVSKWVGDAFEKESIYEMYIHEQGYPFIDNKVDLEPIEITKQIMTPMEHIEAVFTENFHVSDVRNMLSRSKVNGFPVLQRNNLIIGYITRASLTRALEKNKHQINVSTKIVFSKRQIRKAGGQPDASMTAYINRLNLSNYLETSPIQVSEYTTVSSVYNIFKALGIRYVLVTRNGELAGIVTKKDVVNFVSHGTHAMPFIPQMIDPNDDPTDLMDDDDVDDDESHHFGSVPTDEDGIA